MRDSMKFYSAIFLIFSNLLAQGGTVSGRVTDSTNESPLIGANVILEGTSLGAATDNEGRYEIKGLDAGEYVITVSYIGFKNFKEIISLESGQRITKDLVLQPKAIEMETYVVTASRRRERVEDAPAAISVISKTEIRRESNTNLGDYLKGTKGIDFTQSGIDSYNMTARGFNSSFSSRLLTLTDGRMANVPSLRLTAYNVIPVSFEDVEQIEVVLGPSSALYGPNAHSGVLNIVTSSPLRSTGTSINIQGGMLNQTDTDLLKKLTFRTAHKFGDVGIKLSGVALAGQDWTHFNEDEFEGHDPAFIGRPILKNDRLDKGGRLAIESDNNPIFTEEMIDYVEGADESWVGYYWGDYISESGGEDGSPTITQQMIDEASSDPFNRYTLPNGRILWYVTADKLGNIYADGIDNDGDGVANPDDLCEGNDDRIDLDNDSIPDGCDPLIDSDGDGVSDILDRCNGSDDGLDFDNDTIPDDCDDLIDTDNDGVSDGIDICPLTNISSEITVDSTGCALNQIDSDGDGVSDDIDICVGFNDSIDTDVNGIPDDCDNVTDDSSQTDKLYSQTNDFSELSYAIGGLMLIILVIYLKKTQADNS